MRRVTGSVLTLSAVMLVTATGQARAQDASRSVAGGGISVAGWTGRVDPGEAARGGTVQQAKFETMGGGFHVTTGPSISYWKSGATATGDYTVRATFSEPKFQNLNDHPHPYGVFIGGNDLGTDQASMLYCAAYGTGNFIVRGFGPAPFRMNGGRGEASDAVHKAAGVGQPVTQEIALSVRGDKVECAINGTVVASYPKADVVGTGKLKSLDGAYGIRFGHNTEAHVASFGLAPAVKK